MAAAGAVGGRRLVAFAKRHVRTAWLRKGEQMAVWIEENRDEEPLRRLPTSDGDPIHTGLSGCT